MSKTKIEWSEFSWNPVVGCSKVSEGCLNCYAEKMAERLASIACSPKKKAPLTESELAYTNVVQMWHDPKIEKTYWKGWNGKTAFVESALEKPLHWKKPRMIFVCSMSDLFHESVPFEWLDKVMAIIALCPQHKFQILTKQQKRMLEYYTKPKTLKGECVNNQILPTVQFRVKKRVRTVVHHSQQYSKQQLNMWDGRWPLPNLWLGVTCENQRTADERIPILLQIPAAVRFISFEPLLEDIDFNLIERPNHFHSTPYGWLKYFGKQIHWIIIGCESGPKRRPCKLEWVRNIVSQCKAANVPVFIKQLNINGKVEHNIEKFPEDLRIREYPIEK